MPFYIFINSIKVINFWNLCENILGFTRKATQGTWIPTRENYILLAEAFQKASEIKED